MAEPLADALARVRTRLGDESSLVRAVASGRRRGVDPPRWRRVELRCVDLKAGRRLQVTAYDDTQAHTANHVPGPAAGSVLDELVAEPFATWHVETLTGTGVETTQLRVTKRGDALVHVSQAAGVEPQREHDRRKPRLLPEGDPVLAGLGLTDEQGRVRPSRQAKHRQVEELLRDLAPVVDEAVASGRVPAPTAERPLRVVDLGCGNAYLTFAAHRYLGHVRELPVHTTGVDTKDQSRAHNNELAHRLGLTGEMTFLRDDIGSARLDERPDVVLALHACDTATDDALARAVTWDAPVVLAAPCCHHDVAAQLRRSPTPAPYAMLTRSGILRERFADTLTDALRAAVLRLVGYRVEVIDFVDSKHTPRNTLLRAERTGAAPAAGARDELEDLMRTWGVRPRLAELLSDRLG